MVKFGIAHNKNGKIDHFQTALSGYELLGFPELNKGCAFTREERRTFQLDGLLPPQIETLEQQVNRMYEQYSEHKSNLGKNIYLNVLHDYNETLFYKLVSQHLEEMLPIVYTPTVGEAVERFSLELRKPRGLYISYEDRDHMERILENGLPNDVKLIVVTDGEAVLGIGDQGIGGIKICNAKIMVYTLCGGINPHFMFPIQLDVGTNNPSLLADPMYLGWRHERITGQEYDDFIYRFVTAVQKKLPHVYLHWEDFGRDNARRILTQYRDKICTLNGDIQSTGVVVASSIFAACAATGIPLREQKIVIFGAGNAGIGVADQILNTMLHQGLSKQEAYARFWLIDKQGLIVKSQNLLPFHQSYARSHEEISQWDSKNSISLLDVIKQVKPTILIGASAIAGAFTEEIVKTMAKHTKNPIIMPLSNPTAKSEAIPEDLYKWTEGQAIIATGSPFPDVTYHGRQIRIAQSNNAYAFPGIGLGAMAVKAKHISDNMLEIAAEALSQNSPIHQDKSAPLLPRLSEIIPVSRKVAVLVAEQAQKEGLSQIDKNVNLNHAIEQVLWEAKYYPYQKINDDK